jgi:two-component system nitrogen regulation response regulator GlnG
VSKATVLLADDDKAICMVLEQAIREQGHEVITTDNALKLLDLVESGKGDIVITDVLMPGGNGLDMLPRIKATRPNLPVIVISAQNTLLTAVRANQLGATEYMPKPFDLNALIECVDRTLESRQSNDNVKSPNLTTSELQEQNLLIGRSSAMQDIYRVMARLVGNDLTVLIEGESGTGKELVAKALHSLGPRKNFPFVAINVAAIPRELVESELFGHEKGAFTGANMRKAGKFEQAEGGTLFLDEIGDMPLDAQTKLLRVLQQGEYTSVGGSKSNRTNVRIICATHRNLLDLSKSGAFREDLYYRLNVVPVRIPSLRERVEDIEELTQYFLKKSQERGLPSKEISPDAMAVLKKHPWPGNVRELENLIYRLVVIYSERVISQEAVQNELHSGASAKASAEPLTADTRGSFSEMIRAHLKLYFDHHAPELPTSGLHERIIQLVERELLALTLEATGGNQIKASQVLGINRNTLRKKLQELGPLESSKS